MLNLLKQVTKLFCGCWLDRLTVETEFKLVFLVTHQCGEMGLIDWYFSGSMKTVKNYIVLPHTPVLGVGESLKYY